jgi:phosphoribosylamine--glycine ligase
MGAYSPLPWVPAGLVEEVVERVARPTVAELARRGTPFVGVLYCGLALTSRGVRVIEFNCRFGDPETQVVLPRLKTPLGGLLWAAATGKLADAGPLEWRDDAAVVVVLASAGYPGAPRTGDPITLTRPGHAGDAAGEPGAAWVLHAGTAIDAEGRLVSAGGRVLSAVGTGPDLTAARDAAYAAAARIDLRGAQYRHDIARAAAAGAPAGSARTAL